MGIPVQFSDEARQILKQQRGVRLISLYIKTQHAKGLLNDITHAQIGRGTRRIGYETYWKTHEEIILLEVERLVAEYRLQLEVSVGVYDSAGRWRWPQGAPKVPDYVGIILCIHPTRIWAQIPLHERKNN